MLPPFSDTDPPPVSGPGLIRGLTGRTAGHGLALAGPGQVRRLPSSSPKGGGGGGLSLRTPLTVAYFPCPKLSTTPILSLLLNPYLPTIFLYANGLPILPSTSLPFSPTTCIPVWPPTRYLPYHTFYKALVDFLSRPQQAPI